MSTIAIGTMSVPNSFCHTDWQTTWPFLVGLLQAQFAGQLNTINFGNTTPAVEDRDKPWFRTNADGSPDKWYAFINGQWLAAYTGPGPGAIIMWEGAEADIATYEGGEVGGVTLTSGPFWERVTSMNGRSPIGVGTLPDTSTALAVGDTAGVAQVTLALEEIPRHHHGLGNAAVYIQTLNTGDFAQLTSNNVSTANFSPNGGRSDGTTAPHNNVHPVRALYFIKRTARIYHRA